MQGGQPLWVAAAEHFCNMQGHGRSIRSVRSMNIHSSISSGGSLVHEYLKWQVMAEGDDRWPSFPGIRGLCNGSLDLVEGGLIHLVKVLCKFCPGAIPQETRPTACVEVHHHLEDHNENDWPEAC